MSFDTEQVAAIRAYFAAAKTLKHAQEQYHEAGAAAQQHMLEVTSDEFDVDVHEALLREAAGDDEYFNEIVTQATKVVRAHLEYLAQGGRPTLHGDQQGELIGPKNVG